jgi:hypothetical protein
MRDAVKRARPVFVLRLQSVSNNEDDAIRCLRSILKRLVRSHPRLRCLSVHQERP